MSDLSRALALLSLCRRLSDWASTALMSCQMYECLAQSLMYFSHPTFSALLGLQILCLTGNSHGPDESNLPGRHFSRLFPVSRKSPHLSPSHLQQNQGNRAVYSGLTGSDAHSLNSSPDKEASLFLPHAVQTQEVCNSRGVRGAEVVKCVGAAGGQAPWTFDKLELSSYSVAGNVLCAGSTAVPETPSTIPGGS